MDLSVFKCVLTSLLSAAILFLVLVASAEPQNSKHTGRFSQVRQEFRRSIAPPFQKVGTSTDQNERTANLRPVILPSRISTHHINDVFLDEPVVEPTFHATSSHRAKRSQSEQIQPQFKSAAEDASVVPGKKLNENAFRELYEKGMYTLVSSSQDPNRKQPRIGEKRLVRLLTDFLNVPRFYQGVRTNTWSKLLLKEFFKYGLDAFIQDPMESLQWAADSGRIFTYAPIANVVAYLPGKNVGTPNDGIIAITGHYDTHPNRTGLNDNASGIAVMLEIAKALTEAECEFEHTVMFVFLDQEEIGLLGSGYFVERFLAPKVNSKRAYFQGAYNLDTIMNFNSAPQSQRIPDPIKMYIPELAEKIKKSHFKGDFMLVSGRRGIDDRIGQALVNNWRRLDKPKFKMYYMSATEGRTPAPKFEEYFKRGDHWSFWRPDQDVYKGTFSAVEVADTVDDRGIMKTCYHQMCDDDMHMMNPKNVYFIKKLGDAIIGSLLDLANGTCAKGQPVNPQKMPTMKFASAKAKPKEDEGLYTMSGSLTDEPPKKEPEPELILDWEDFHLEPVRKVKKVKSLDEKIEKAITSALKFKIRPGWNEEARSLVPEFRSLKKKYGHHDHSHGHKTVTGKHKHKDKTPQENLIGINDIDFNPAFMSARSNGRFGKKKKSQLQSYDPSQEQEREAPASDTSNIQNRDSFNRHLDPNSYLSNEIDGQFDSNRMSLPSNKQKQERQLDIQNRERQSDIRNRKSSNRQLDPDSYLSNEIDGQFDNNRMSLPSNIQNHERQLDIQNRESFNKQLDPDSYLSNEIDEQKGDNRMPLPYAKRSNDQEIAQQRGNGALRIPWYQNNYPSATQNAKISDIPRVGNNVYFPTSSQVDVQHLPQAPIYNNAYRRDVPLPEIVAVMRNEPPKLFYFVPPWMRSNIQREPLPEHLMNYNKFVSNGYTDSKFFPPLRNIYNPISNFNVPRPASFLGDSYQPFYARNNSPIFYWSPYNANSVDMNSVTNSPNNENQIQRKQRQAILENLPYRDKANSYNNKQFSSYNSRVNGYVPPFSRISAPKPVPNITTFSGIDLENELPFRDWYPALDNPNLDLLPPSPIEDLYSPLMSTVQKANFQTLSAYNPTSRLQNNMAIDDFDEELADNNYSEEDYENNTPKNVFEAEAPSGYIPRLMDDRSDYNGLGNDPEDYANGMEEYLSESQSLEPHFVSAKQGKRKMRRKKTKKDNAGKRRAKKKKTNFESKNDNDRFIKQLASILSSKMKKKSYGADGKSGKAKGKKPKKKADKRQEPDILDAKSSSPTRLKIQTKGDENYRKIVDTFEKEKLVPTGKGSPKNYNVEVEVDSKPDEKAGGSHKHYKKKVSKKENSDPNSRFQVEEEETVEHSQSSSGEVDGKPIDAKILRSPPEIDMNMDTDFNMDDKSSDDDWGSDSSFSDLFGEKKKEPFMMADDDNAKWKRRKQSERYRKKPDAYSRKSKSKSEVPSWMKTLSEEAEMLMDEKDEDSEVPSWMRQITKPKWIKTLKAIKMMRPKKKPKSRRWPISGKRVKSDPLEQLRKTFFSDRDEEDSESKEPEISDDLFERMKDKFSRRRNEMTDDEDFDDDSIFNDILKSFRSKQSAKRRMNFDRLQRLRQPLYKQRLKSGPR